MTGIFTAESVAAVEEMIPAWPDAIERGDERKGEKYWQYFDRKRAQFDGTFAFGIQIPGQAVAQYLAITFAPGGAVSAVEVLDEPQAVAKAKIAMKASEADWQGIVDGYDIGKAMTYHQLPLTKGGSLDLLRCVYFLHELIVILTRAATRASVAA